MDHDDAHTFAQQAVAQGLERTVTDPDVLHQVALIVHAARRDAPNGRVA